MIVSSTRAVLWSWLIPHSEGQTPDSLQRSPRPDTLCGRGRPYDQRLPLVPRFRTCVPAPFAGSLCFELNRIVCLGPITSGQS